MDLNFLTQTYSQTLTMVRASAGWYWNSAGVLTQASSNALRIDYDPNTLALKGALIEDARTNLLKHSTDQTSADWFKSGSITAVTGVAAPDGTTNACTITKTASANAQCSQGFNPAVNGTSYCFSVYLKPGTHTQAQMQLDVGAVIYKYTLNLSTGGTTSVTTTGTGGVITSQNVGNGWYRYAIWITSASTSTFSCTIWPDLSATGVAGSILMWQAQLEALLAAGQPPTSPILTTTATVTRAVDDLRVLGIGYLNSALGTYIAELDVSNFTNFPPAVNDINTASAILVFNNVGQGRTSNNVQTLTSANAFTAGTAGKLGTTWLVAGGRQVCANGGAVVSDANVGIYPSTGIRLGDYRLGSNSINGHYRRLRYWPRVMGSAELIATTT